MKKFVAFGEVMLRLSPIGYERFVQAKQFNVFFAGGEANVAASLANFGLDSYYVTKLPAHEIGQAAINEMRRFGIKTDFVVRGGNRIGVYFCEKGASQRPSKVIYDRGASSIAEAKRDDFDWKSILNGAKWFHFTGITPALSDNCIDITLDALKVAKESGVAISVDLNYRNKLWSTKKANEVMTELVKYCDVLIANEEDAEKVFDIKAGKTDVKEGKLCDEGYKEVAKELHNRFGLKIVAFTLRESHSASYNGWSGMLYDGKQYYKSKKYDINIIDRVGGGDSFCGGLIYGLSSGMDNQSALEFATAASCLKHSIEGDFNMMSIDEVQNLMKGDASGRVQR
ncbi:MAG: sugar kinase [Lutispora sp.]|nr:sugar kinase [Lutispora sp.]